MSHNTEGCENANLTQIENKSSQLGQQMKHHREDHNAKNGIQEWRKKKRGIE